jgi:hypothetical protein
LIVPDRTKRVLQHADLRRVVFHPTALVAGRTPEEREKVIQWDKHAEPWWELTSDLILPPLSPSVSLFDQDGNPIRDDFSNGCYAVEGQYSSPILSYRRSDLQSIGGFDLAKTFEIFGAKGSKDMRLFIASRKFYDFCKSNQIDAAFTPVRVEGD